jgi:hypothetical protein
LCDLAKALTHALRSPVLHVVALVRGVRRMIVVLSIDGVSDDGEAAVHVEVRFVVCFFILVWFAI